MFSLNYRDASLDDIIALLNASGFVHEKSEFNFARENDLFKFLGVSSDSIRYMVGFDDGPNEGDMYAAILYVKVSNSECGFSADWGGCPVFETRDLDELEKYFEQRCN
jgi:hypothetical protein